MLERNLDVRCKSLFLKVARWTNGTLVNYFSKFVFTVRAILSFSHART